MHDILVEQARRKSRKKRGGGWKRADADQLVAAIDAPPSDLIALSEALEELADEDPRGHKLVMLRFFGGLTLADAAQSIGISLATAKRDWLFVKARLHSQLTEPLTQALNLDSVV